MGDFSICFSEHLTGHPIKGFTYSAARFSSCISGCKASAYQEQVSNTENKTAFTIIIPFLIT